jgi:hypothetical protein
VAAPVEQGGEFAAGVSDHAGQDGAAFHRPEFDGGSQNTPLDGAGTHRPCVLMMRFTRLLGPLTCTNSSQRPAPGRCRSGSLAPSGKGSLCGRLVLGQLLQRGLDSCQVRREAWSAMFVIFGLVD